MKRLSVFAVCLSLTLMAAAQTQDQAKSLYAADSKKIESGDLSFNWKDFRLAAYQGGTPYFDWHPVRTQFMQQLDQGDFSAALQSANDIMHHNMADPEGHLLALVVYQKLGQTQDAAYQHKIVDAYAQSILSSGDGKSSKTAYYVVDVGEEYFYLNIILGVGIPESQSLVSVDGHSFDLLKVKDKDGNEQKIWFNVDTSMNAMRDAIEGSKKK